MRVLKLGTRPSRLAQRQTEVVATALRAVRPELQVDIKIYTTQGDQELSRPLPEIGGKGLFTSEIEAALRAGEIDLAVHSFKDLPIASDASGAGLAIGATLEREDARDVLVSRHRLPLADLPPGPRIGTSSPRRAAQILAARPDARIVSLRGNVDTRLRKAAGDDYDAVILAAAGLVRMGLVQPITQALPFEVMLPAPAQGALAVQCRADDEAVLALLRSIHHPPTWAAVSAERAFLSGLGGGCAAPVAAYAVERPAPGVEDGGPSLWLRGLVASLDGRQVVRVAASGTSQEAEQLGLRLAQAALAEGAAALLALAVQGEAL